MKIGNLGRLPAAAATAPDSRRRRSSTGSAGAAAVGSVPEGAEVAVTVQRVVCDAKDPHLGGAVWPALGLDSSAIAAMAVGMLTRTLAAPAVGPHEGGAVILAYHRPSPIGILYLCETCTGLAQIARLGPTLLD